MVGYENKTYEVTNFEEVLNIKFVKHFSVCWTEFDFHFYGVSRPTLLTYENLQSKKKEYEDYFMLDAFGIYDKNNKDNIEFGSVVVGYLYGFKIEDFPYEFIDCYRLQWEQIRELQLKKFRLFS